MSSRERRGAAVSGSLNIPFTFDCDPSRPGQTCCPGPRCRLPPTCTPLAAIYLHIPFCAQRCIYCDFYFVTTQRSPAPFVSAIQAEIADYGATYGPLEKVETIYFGGGTPSRLPLHDVAAILTALRTHFQADDLRELTFEVNPDDCTDEYLRGLRDLGVDRLSIGVQSFFEADLRWMNRAHTAEQAEASIALAQEVGFTSFSVDLIFGLPEQPEEYWYANVQKAVRLGAPHLSTYGLTVEEKTVLGNRVARGLVTPAPEETMAERYRFTLDYLRESGFEGYEISSFARPGHRAVHNSLYWTHANYLGFGPSAHAFWWQNGPEPGAHRWSNVRHLGRYTALLGQRQRPLDEKQRLSLDALANEYVLLRLRTADGLDLDTLNTRYSADLLDEKADEIAWLEQDGLVTLRNRTLRLTDSGRLLADAVTERLLFSELYRGL